MNQSLAGKFGAFMTAAALSLAVVNPALAAAENWAIDATHSHVGFTVRHFVAKTSGRFATFEGTIAMDPEKLDLTKVNVSIDAASVDTDNDKRDAHLKTADFFDVAKHPKITFTSTAVKPTDKETGVLVGDLTINGITKPVELAYTVLGFGPDPWGNQRAGFEATGKVNRRDFNVSWNGPAETVVVADEVTLNLAVELIKEKPAEKK